MGVGMFSTRVLCTVSVLLSGVGTVVRAQPAPDYDFQWATVGSPGNPAYQAPFPPSEDTVHNRGSVPYEYRISRLEVSTAQWLEFQNAFAEVPGNPLYFGPPGHWGATISRVIPSTGRFVYSLVGLPNAGQLPVGGMSWRDAARYCNWLHNNKEVSLAAISTGAYDTTTWGRNADGTISDAPTHMPGANYWIPTLDEYLKSTHFDPNKNGPGQAGWWSYKNSADSPAITGLPGVGTTSAGYRTLDDNDAGWLIPLGAYTTSLSPWGLWDTSGGGAEWTEDLFGNRERGYVGSAVNDIGGGAAFRDYIGRIGSQAVNFPQSTSFRIVSPVPTPPTSTIFVLCAAVITRRNRR